MSDLDITWNDLAVSWGARNWQDAQRLITAGYAFCVEIREGRRVCVLADKQTMKVVGTVDEVRAMLDAGVTTA